MLLKILRIFLFFLMWNTCFAQIVRHFSTEDGLPDNYIYKVIQDHQGFLWVLTEKGIAKYDGNSFKIFTTRNGLPLNDIWDIRITPDNKIWYFSKSNSLGYIKNDSVYRFYARDTARLFFPVVILQSGNTLGFLSNKKFYYLKNNRFEHIKIPSNIGIAIQQNKGQPEIKYIFIKTGRTIQAVSPENNSGIAHSLDHFGYIQYHGQPNDSLYMWLSEKKVLIFHIKKKRFYEINFGRKVKFPRFYTQKNNIYLTGKNYLVRLNNTTKLQHIPVDTTLNAHYFYLDKTNNLWMASFSGGLYMLPAGKRQVQYFFRGHKVEDLQYINNKIIASVYGKGFYVFNASKREFKPYVPTSEYLYNAFYNPETGHELYITNYRMYALRDGHNLKQIKNTLPAKGTRMEYYNHRLYAIVPSGLNVLDARSYRIIKTYLMTGLRDLVVRNDSVILAGLNGLKLLRHDSLTSLLPEFTKPVQKILFVRNKLLLCTDGFGAYLTDFNRINKLEDSGFLSIESAKMYNDTLFLATQNGVWLYDMQKTIPRLIKKIDRTAGLPGKIIHDILILDTSLMASGNQGLSIITLQEEKSPDQFLYLYFDKIIANNKSLQNHAKIPYSKHMDITAHVKWVDYSGVSPVVYQYKLEPVQKTWKKVTSPTLTFSQLSPGEYQLHIKKGALHQNFLFEITPKWWQTSWAQAGFLLFFVLTVGSVAWGMSIRRQRALTRKVLREKQMSELQLKALRSQMNPHFVFNSLASIQYFISRKDLKRSDKYLVKFSKLIRRFFELSKEDEIPLKQEVELLKNYLEVEKMRFGDKLDFMIEVDSTLDLENETIPTMLLQPIVENAVNHGIFNKDNPGKVEIKFKKAPDGSLIVKIIDDGVGIYKNNPRQNKRLKSSSILNDRIYFLNQSGEWKISYWVEELFPKKQETGTVFTFKITKL